jgi:hypothetical protein
MLNRILTFFGCNRDDTQEYETVQHRSNIGILAFVRLLNEDGYMSKDGSGPSTPVQTIKWDDGNICDYDPQPATPELGEKLIEELDTELDEELAQCERAIARFK